MHIVSVIFLFLSSRLVLGDESAKIVIIGAGPAGIAAGSKLLKNNFKNVEILEAEDRIGGRVFSVKVDDAYVELGAEFCMGNNIVFEMANKYDVFQKTRSNPNISDSDIFYYSDGNKLDEKLNKDILKSLFQFFEVGINTTDKITMKEGFLRHYNSTLLSKYKDDIKSLKILSDGLYSMEALVNGVEGTFSWDDSVYESNWEDISGGDYTWKGMGYKTILDIMMDNYPKKSEKSELEKKIKLSTEVENINREGNKLKIKTKDGSIMEADHVIFTPSVGVLKNQQKSLFTPDLPEDKQKAIDNIGFAAITKLVVKFEKPWWNSDEFYAIEFLWSKEDLLKIKDEFPEGPQKDGISWIASISSFTVNKYNPNVLVMWVAGKMVPDIEKLSDDVIQKGTMYMLKKFLGKTHNVTEAVTILRNPWYSNPHFRGTYSYETPKIYESETNNQNVLGSPLKDKNGAPVLMFAGEATNSKHYGSVHGAIETGFREADRLIEHYKKNNVK